MAILLYLILISSGSEGTVITKEIKQKIENVIEERPQGVLMVNKKGHYVTVIDHNLRMCDDKFLASGL